MTTITDIRNDLVNVFNKLRDGTMEAKEAVEINNTAGKIISSAKVQLAYAALRGEQPNIAFLDSAVPLPVATIKVAEPKKLAAKEEAEVTTKAPDSAIDKLWHNKIGTPN